MIKLRLRNIKLRIMNKNSGHIWFCLTVIHVAIRAPHAITQLSSQVYSRTLLYGVDSFMKSSL
ncbi:hypothetical protein LINPERPRIM_LOCUS108 [Linum perenne]